MKKKSIIIVSILVLVSIVGGLVYYFWFRREKGLTDIATTVAKRGEFLIVVSEVGKLDAAKSVNVSSNTQGKIIKMVLEGTVVKKNDPVVWLDTTDTEKQIKDAEASLKSEEANYQKTEENERLSIYSNEMNVKSAKSQLANAQAELESARTKLARTQRLFDAQLTPETSLEEAKLTVLGAELGVQNTEISLAKAEETRKSGEVSSKINLQQAKDGGAEAKRKLDQLKDQLKDAMLTAPSDGIVVYSATWRSGTFGKVQEGDQVWPRMNIMTIPDLTKMISIVQIDEIDISRVQNGQEVIIRVDALPDVILQGTVSRIATLAVDKGAGDAPFWMQREASGVKVFEVVADVEPSSSSYDLRPGMTTKVDIVINRFDDVVTVPLESVFDYQDKKVVYSLSSKIPVRREVILGKSDGNYVIIEKGVTAGERVCLRDPTKELKETGTKKIEQKAGTPEISSTPSAMPMGTPPPSERPGRREGAGGQRR
ncbi:MAG: HlyD family efflux transporter periplasmic adaptor subunit [bacterium]|nr:HlyD family efflux transporter periplasmic adaptor subunit [bacterium]